MTIDDKPINGAIQKEDVEGLVHAMLDDAAENEYGPELREMGVEGTCEDLLDKCEPVADSFAGHGDAAQEMLRPHVESWFEKNPEWKK